jgi:uncharacterized protein
MYNYAYNVCIRVYCPPKKNAINIVKHKGISLADGEPVLYDELGLDRPDDDTPGGLRRVVLGRNEIIDKILVVAYEIDEHADVITILSVRKAMPKERRQYHEGE